MTPEMQLQLKRMAEVMNKIPARWFDAAALSYVATAVNMYRRSGEQASEFALEAAKVIVSIREERRIDEILAARGRSRQAAVAAFSVAQ